MLSIALLIDGALGEPGWLWRRLPHPVVLMGRAVGWADRLLNRGSFRRQKGVLAIVLLVFFAIVIGYMIRLSGVVGETIVAAILMAQRSLMQHVSAVAAALRRSLDAGRDAVRLIVGRDPGSLNEAAVARAAVESAAENFSDGVVAPAFWFCVAGAPGIIAYKMINTADSMIGYRSEKYLEFGWASARLDDLVNLVPARISGFIIALAARQRRVLHVMLRDAAKHRSPNAGWPEAAAAGALGLALAGPRRYGETLTKDPYLNADGRQAATAADIDASSRLMWRAWALLLIISVFFDVWRWISPW
jgi:adenosylcobinamide-phosphate synthase